MMQPKSKKNKKDYSKSSRKWKEEKINTLIDLLEQHTCLWDLLQKEYHSKDKKFWL